MGRLMLSLLLSEQFDTKNSSNVTEERSPSGSPVEDCVMGNSVPKWSASNAFDPDSEEFWSGDDVVYEAFVDNGMDGDGDGDSMTVDEDDEGRRERFEEEAHLIASGNESRRRRRENPWLPMETLLTPEPQDVVGEFIVTDSSGFTGPISTEPTAMSTTTTTGNGARVRIYGETVIMDRARRTNPDNERLRDHVNDPSLTTRGLRTLHSQSRGNSSRHLSPLPSRFTPTPTPSGGTTTADDPIDTITDVAHRTTSPVPIPYFRYGDVHVYSRDSQRLTRHRRRESQPAPTISLMG